MAEQFANKAQTTLNGAIDSDDTSLVVTSATGFPTSGEFRIFIKGEGSNTDEICTVTAVSGTTFTVTRASEAIGGTQTASSHASGTEVAHVLTAGAINRLASGQGFIGCSLYRTTNQTVTAGVETSIEFNAEQFDTDGFHDNVTNNSRVTIPVGLGGKYLVSWTFSAGSSPGESYAQIRKNGDTSYATAQDNSPGSNTGLTGSIMLDLIAGDYIEIRGYRSSGTTFSGGLPSGCYLHVIKLDSGSIGQGIGARVARTTDQTGIATGTDTRVSFTSEIFDTDGFHSNDTNPSRLTIPTGLGGKYLLTANIVWDTNTSGIRQVWFWKNGGTDYAGFDRRVASSYASQAISAIMDLAANDYVEVNVYQDSTTDRTLTGSLIGSGMQFSIMRLDSGTANYSGPLWGSGTAFPSGPVTNQRFTRTDLGLDFYYDGTRWVTTTLYRYDLSMFDYSIVTTNNSVISAGPSWAGAYDIWIEDVHYASIVDTTNNGSNYWTMTLYKAATSGADVAINSRTTAADTADINTQGIVAEDALAGTNAVRFYLFIAKTNSPGGIRATCGFTYRLVGT